MRAGVLFNLRNGRNDICAPGGFREAMDNEGFRGNGFMVGTFKVTAYMM